MKIDESGRDDRAGGVDDVLGVIGREPANLGDLTVLDPDIAAEPRHPGPVDNQPIPDDRVELWHRVSPLSARYAFSV